jgi:thymidylate kinase
MSAIAIIGADGAGKTTITHMLLEASPLPFKYVYMGINPEASNFALPTTRLVAYLKRRSNPLSYQTRPSAHMHHMSPSSQQKRGGALRAAARLVNRLAEEWYRQLVSWYYQLQGYVVLYDRHFAFDFFLPGAQAQVQRLSIRLHNWCLSHLYPHPDLTIYLDAPAEVLFARKGEWDVSYLETRRQLFLHQGRQVSNFVRVDATQSLDLVYAEVLDHIMCYYRLEAGSLACLVRFRTHREKK